MCWCEGLDAPLFSYWSGALARMCPPIAVADPERFGWKPPRRIADFMPFAQRFADACEAQL